MTNEQQAKKKSDEPKRPWRENLEAVTMAIIMAVMLKYFVVEAYKIPTGSMQPTLMGLTWKTGTNPGDEDGLWDRIIVDKLSYHFREPKRWEVSVFKYPLDRSKNFIKRICGMPNEELAIRDGDLWTRASSAQEWKILRRPDPVQDEVWKRLNPTNPRFQTWFPLDGTKGWTVDGRANVTARGDGAVRLPSAVKLPSVPIDSVLDDYKDGYPDGLEDKLTRAANFAATNPVGDLRLCGEVKALGGCKKVILELREGEFRHRFELPGPAAPADAAARILSENTERASSAPAEIRATPWRLPAGKSIAFAAQNMDDMLRLEIDGLRLELEIPASHQQRSSFTLRSEGEGADFSDLELYRDIFYLSGRQSEFTIPSDYYVMLGDNTQDSSDSREWELCSYKWPGKGSNDTWVRGNKYGNQNPTLVPGEPEGTRVFLRDEWGDLHTFTTPPGQPGRNEAAPLVPRELVLGRAVCVFWPQTWLWPPNWFDTSVPKVWRLRWVH